MNKSNIKHICFDLGGTLVRENLEYITVHNELRYKTYAEATDQALTDKLREKYEKLYKKYGTNSAIFRSLGFPSDYWQNHFNKLDRSKVYYYDLNIYQTILNLRQIVPLSIFTTITKDATYKTFKTLEIGNLDPEYFQFIISGDDVMERKPALEGYYLVINKTNLKPKQILYVGDRVNADIIPAKKAGMKTCLIWQESNEADYCIKNLSELLEIIKS